MEKNPLNNNISIDLGVREKAPKNKEEAIQNHLLAESFDIDNMDSEKIKRLSDEL